VVRVTPTGPLRSPGCRAGWACDKACEFNESAGEGRTLELVWPPDHPDAQCCARPGPAGAGTGLAVGRVTATSTLAEYATIGEYNTNTTASGTDVTVSSISGSGSVPSCSFPSYPGL